ncbi:hypothetical protein Tco_0287016, partial [Tanacetum coccineum]
MRKEIHNCSSPVSLDELIAVQKGVKARFGGNEDQKKTWKDHTQASRSLELDVRIGHSYGVKAAAAPTHSAFIGAASSGSKLTYSDQQNQDMIYEDFDQVDQLEMEELDLKWQMAMLSLRINRECNVKTVDDKARYSAFKVTEVKTDEPKALVSVILLVNWSDHAAENKTGEVEKVYGMMAGLHADNGGAGVSDAAAEFAMMGISPKWKESSKNLNKLINSSMFTRTKIGLGFKEYFGVDEVFDLSRPSTMYPKPVEEEVKTLFTQVCQGCPGDACKFPFIHHGTYLPSHYYGSKSNNKTSKTLSESNDFVSCDNSDKLSDSETYASCDSSLKTKTKDSPPAVDIKTVPESDVKDPNSTTGSPSFSCLENVKSPMILCNNSGMNNRNVCKNNSVRVKKCFVCGSKLHLIKDCDFYNCVDSVPCKAKAASVLAGSRNSSASVTAGGFDSAASRNRPAVNSAGRPNPTGRVGQTAQHAAAQSNLVSWSKRQAPVSAGRPVTAGRLNPAARPYFRPSSVYCNNKYWPGFYDPTHMNEGRRGTAGDPSTDSDIGIVDSGCSRSMTGNKEKLADFVQIKGGIVKFGGGDGQISGKGTIRTSTLDFENVYYVEELQHFNLFSVSQICDQKNKVLFTDTDCLVLTKDFQLPDDSQVVLRIPKERDLYTFSISDLQPEHNAQKDKKVWQVKYEKSLARFDKWKESSKNLKKLINSSMLTRTKIGLGFQDYFGVDEVFDLSTPSVMYLEPVEDEVRPLYSRFVKAGEMHAVPPPITETYMPIPYKLDMEETQVSYGSKSDNKTSKTLSESNDFVSCDNSDKLSDSETYASCDSSLKTKTKDSPPAVDIKTVPESDVKDPNSTTGSPSFSCLENVKSPMILCNNSGMNNRNVCKNNSVRHLFLLVVGIRALDQFTAGGSDSAASRNRPAVNSAGRPNPAGWSKRPATVSAGRLVSAGWFNPAARPYFRPSSVFFNNMYRPDLYDSMYMNEGCWGTAVKTLAGRYVVLLVSADRIMVLLVVILPAGRLVSAGFILPAGRMVSAGCTMVLLVVIFLAGRLVSAGCTMVLLVVIVPAGFFVPAGSYGLCC